MNNKNLDLISSITRVVTIIICAVLTPIFIIFLLLPNTLIPGYTYDEYANLYIIYTGLFIFFLALTIGIYAIVKRYVERSIEENVTIQQQTSQPIVQQSVSNNEGICPSCGAEILDKIGGFCSKCGATIK